MLRGKSNLVFIGFMGSGKSSVARLLGKKLGKPVVSTDEMIERAEAKTIPGIFEEFGEAHFRELEKQAVREASLLKNVIIDCGGGVVLDQENIDRLKANGCLVFLAAGPEFLYEKIKDQKHRPLLAVKDPLKKIRQLLQERKTKYKQADITLISEDRTIEEIVNEIIELIKND
jgi:shikimate kinase